MQRLPVNIYRARQALARLHERVTPRRSEGWLFASQDPALRARVRQAVAEQVARVLTAPVDHAGHIPYPTEGPGQGLTRMTPDPVWFLSHDRTPARIFPDTDPPSGEVLALRDALAGYLGGQGGVDSLKTEYRGWDLPSAVSVTAGIGCTLRIRLDTGTTIDIDLTEVTEC